MIAKKPHPTLADLEARALAAHNAGTPWATFWPSIRPDVLRLVGVDRRRFRKVYGVLLSIAVAGNLDGAEPIGDLMPWERDEQAEAAGKPDDTVTHARCLLPRRARLSDQRIGNPQSDVKHTGACR